MIRFARRHCAFTLVELIVVVAVIAILAALILASMHIVRRKAGAAHSATNIRILAQANIAYLAENGCFVPADDRRNNRRWHGARRSVTGTFDPADGFLAPYLGKSRRVTPCPVFQDMLKGDNSFEEGAGGYGYNSSYIGGTPAGKWNSDGTRESAVAAMVERPARTVMFTSSAYARLEGLQEYPFCEPPFWDFGSGPSGYRPAPTVHFRFGGKALVAWCDGHVTFEKRDQRPEGDNPHGGQAWHKDLGWFGPDHDNGYWNPRAEFYRGNATAR